jgi:hypothetical protein
LHVQLSTVYYNIINIEKINYFASFGDKLFSRVFDVPKHHIAVKDLHKNGISGIWIGLG